MTTTLRRKENALDSGLGWGDGVGDGAAEAPVSLGEKLAGIPKVAPVEVGPEGVEVDVLGVGRLPQQEVACALLAGGAQEQVHLRYLRMVEIFGDELLVHLVWPEPSGGDVLGDGGCGVGDFGLAAVVYAELKGQLGVAAAHLLGRFE